MSLPPPPTLLPHRFGLHLSLVLLPRPTLHDVFAPEDTTEEPVAEFFYILERPRYERKTLKECSRIELLRWHPDKFLEKVLGKVDEEHRAMLELRGYWL